MSSIAREVSTFNTYKSYQHMVRVLMLICIGLFLVCLGLSSALVVTIPLKEIRPMILTLSDQKNQVLRVEPIEKNVKGIQLITEKLAMRYVELRETFDFVTDNERYVELQNLSSSTLFEAYWQMIKPENPKSPRKKFLENKLTRSVHIKNCISLAPSAANTYRIEWESIDCREGQEVDRKQWISTMAFRFEEREVRYEDQYINPLGLMVTNYTISKKES